uniref:Uncharacterized protein n=1 Tax=Cucumis melo TaxID=3656 RepID=A0A9I9DSZ3_CUCME
MAQSARVSLVGSGLVCDAKRDRCGIEMVGKSTGVTERIDKEARLERMATDEPA